MKLEEEKLCALAEEALATFEKISNKATEKLEDSGSNPEESFAAVNTFTSLATNNLANIQDKNRQSYLSLQRAPAIARILVENEEGEKKLYYISRHGSIPLSGDTQLADYNTEIGRLASLPVGEEKQIQLKNRQTTFIVLGRCFFKPARDSLGWQNWGQITVTSNISNSCALPTRLQA